MSLAFHESAILAALLLLAEPVAGRELKVCADPNNLPFSNIAQQGFENRIVEVVADELRAEVRYVWWAQRRGFVGNALDAGLCDLIPGVARIEGILLTWPPYYRSTYAFVTRSGEAAISSFDDPMLHCLEVGIHLIAEGVGTPPAEMLSRRGIIDNVRGYSLLGDYGQPNPPADLIQAVAAGEVDVGVAWGPLAGYFARRASVPLTVTPVADPYDPTLPMVFDIAMGLRLDEGELRMEVEEAIARRRDEIDAILAEYDVPRLDR